jgi:hypothetical protein
MSLWVLIVLLGVLKAVMGGLMLWIPYRNEQRSAMNTTATNDAGDAGESDAPEDEGGSKALPASPWNPRPRSPRPRPRRRGPHGSDPAPPSPARVRTPALRRAGVRRADQRLRLR